MKHVVWALARDSTIQESTLQTFIHVSSELVRAAPTAWWPPLGMRYLFVPHRSLPEIEGKKCSEGGGGMKDKIKTKDHQVHAA